MLGRWLGLGLTLLMGNGLTGQETLRVEVKLVNVAFTARDAKGALDTGLTKDSVEVFEDAVPQKVAFFAKAENVALTLGLIVDASGSQDPFAKQHAHDLEVFLSSVLRPQDRVFVVGFGNHVRVVSDDSNSPGEILERLKRWQQGGGGGLPELGPKEERELGTAFYDSIFYAVTEKLAGATGRRALLVFSDGEDNSSSHTMMEAIESAQSANVPVYTIRYTEEKHGRLNARNKYGISVMNRVAAETGSLAVDASATDPHTYFREIAEELRGSYELAYYPTNAEKDNTFRKITIKAKDRATVIRCRTGYFAR